MNSIEICSRIMCKDISNIIREYLLPNQKLLKFLFRDTLETIKWINTIKCEYIRCEYIRCECIESITILKILNECEYRVHRDLEQFYLEE